MSGQRLGTSPIEVRGTSETNYSACRTTRNLTNGSCQLVDAAGIVVPDADCFFDVNWSLTLRDGGEAAKSAPVAVGFGIAIHVQLAYDVVGLISVGT